MPPKQVTPVLMLLDFYTGTTRQVPQTSIQVILNGNLAGLITNDTLVSPYDQS